jgi:hypothetical protein
MEPKTPFCNKESLDEVIRRDNATLIGNYEKITRNMIIKFICNCGEESQKNCYQLIGVSGAYCKKCTRIRWNEKTRNTNIERYGVVCTVHAPEIKEQIVNNLMEKYGVDNILKVPEIKNKIKTTILEKYGVDHIMHSDDIKNKIQKQCMEKYGVANTTQLDDVKNKMKQTVLKKYGVDHYSKTEQYKKQTKETCLKKYGVDHFSKSNECKTKRKETFIKNYGVDNPNKTPEVREKIRQTNLQRYGVEHISQSKEIMEKIQKNSKKYKEYIMPSGEIRKIQGYEPFALDEIIKLYSEDDIITDRANIPCISYTNTNNKSVYYFPDIYIKSINKIIEVKSTWTYNCKHDNIHEKANATKEAGYDYEIWVYDDKGNKQIV